MKNFEILLNNKYSATTQAFTTGLDLQNDYYVYVNKNGGGIVNQYNVRGYLNDSRNQQITNDFLAYLTGSTSADQALNILTADKKLSDTFNDYYQRVIISATQISSTAVIQQNLTGTTQIVANDYIHPWAGYAPDNQLTGITKSINGPGLQTNSSLYLQDFTTDESYYIPVYLERGTNQLSRYKYDVCDVFINSTTSGFYPNFSAITNSYFSGQTQPTDSASTRIHTIVDCFVDLNLETNENAQSVSPNLSVSFEPNEFGNFAYFQTAEPSPAFNYVTSATIKVKLDKPSVYGIEEATISLYASDALLNTDFTASEIFPVTFTWDIGEQEKILTFTAKTDFIIEETEYFNLQISNLLNVEPGPILDAQVMIADTTILRNVSLQVGGIPTGFDGIGRGSTEEGNDFELVIYLDGPAYGGESVTINQVPTISTPNVTLGPAVNPLLPSDYTMVYYPNTNTPIFNQTFPKNVSFAPGETSKSFNVWIKENNSVNPTKTGYFEISNAQMSVIDQSKKVAEITVLDNEGQFKYVHLDLGKIYSELGDSPVNTLMRQVNPQPGIGGSYNNIYLNQYSNNIFQYGTTINWKDYYGTNQINSVTYDTSLVKLKITNTGIVQSIVNGIPLNVGQTTLVTVTGNDFIVTATTNSSLNSTTISYDFANYKIEILNNYSGTIIPLNSSSNPQPVQFNLRTTSNTLSTDNLITIGNYSFSGMTNYSNDISHKYNLKSKYKNVNTGRPNIGTVSSPIYTCPTVASSSLSVSYNEFYAVDIENISVLGIIFLNFSQNIDYNTSPMTNYDSFEFITEDEASLMTTTCSQSNSMYNGLDYISIPFYLEP